MSEGKSTLIKQTDSGFGESRCPGRLRGNPRSQITPLCFCSFLMTFAIGGIPHAGSWHCPSEGQDPASPTSGQAWTYHTGKPAQASGPGADTRSARPGLTAKGRVLNTGLNSPWGQLALGWWEGVYCWAGMSLLPEALLQRLGNVTYHIHESITRTFKEMRWQKEYVPNEETKIQNPRTARNLRKKFQSNNHKMSQNFRRRIDAQSKKLQEVLARSRKCKAIKWELNNINNTNEKAH